LYLHKTIMYIYTYRWSLRKEKRTRKNTDMQKYICTDRHRLRQLQRQKKRKTQQHTHTHTHTHTYTVCVSLSLTHTPDYSDRDRDRDRDSHSRTNTHTHTHAHTPDAATMSGLPEGITEAPRLRIEAFSGSRVEYGLSRNVGSISRFFTRYCGLNPRAMPTRCEGLAIEGGRGALTSVAVSV